MAKKDIDNIQSSSVPKPKKGKGLKKFFAFMIFLILIASVVIGIYMYIENNKKALPKQDFINYLKKDNILNVLQLEKANNLNLKLQSETSESTTEFTADIPEMLTDKLSLGDMKIEINSKNDPELKKQNSDVLIKYKDNDILNFNILSNENKIGVFSEDILTKYIGSKYSGLSKVISGFVNYKNKLPQGLNIDFDNIKDIKFSFPQLSNEMLLKYIDIINKKIPENNFSNKKITLERNSEKLDVNEYAMTLNEEQAINLIDQILQTLENDDELLDSLISSFIRDDEQIKQLEENFKEIIEKYINYLYQTPIDNNRIYSLKVYGSKDITYKMILDLAGESSIDIDYEYGENENKMTVTFLESDSQDGISIDLIKTITDFSENLDFTINKIDNSDIVGKINIVFDLKNSGNSYTFKNTVDCNFMFVKLNSQINSIIEFKATDVDNLDDENCLFLDEQNKDVFDSVIKDVKNATVKVVTDNLIGQGVIPPPEIPVEEPPSNEETKTIDRETLKEQAKNKLTNSISEAITNAQSQGQTYTLDDLINLQIPDSSFTVSVNGSEASVSIDGFEFKLDSNFQVYDK